MPTFTKPVLVLGVCCLSAVAASAQQYTPIDLGTLGGATSYPAAINASGQVVGTAYTANGNPHPFLWDSGVMHDLGVLPGYSYCSATAINDAPQVVGICIDQTRNQVTGFIWSSAAGIQPLGTPINAEPYGINNSGLVAGTVGAPDDPHAFTFKDGVFTNLGRGRAWAINDAGKAAGSAPTPTWHAVTWDSSGAHDAAPPDIPSEAYAISPGGLPAGIADIDQSNVAAVFTSDGVGNLGTLGPGGQANGIRSGLVVGASGGSAFVYDLNGPGVMVDLNERIPPNSIPWRLVNAVAVNAAGAIPVYGFDFKTGAVRAILLTPGTNPPPSNGNLLIDGGFEEYTPPQLGPPGWVSDDFRQVAAKSETNQPRTGEKNGACWTTDNLDCGMFQDLRAPATGTYTLTIYANADRPGALVGANVNDATVAFANVEVRGFANYGAGYVLTFSAAEGETIRVWMYSPAVPGYLVIDDASLTRPGS